MQSLARVCGSENKKSRGLHGLYFTQFFVSSFYYFLCLFCLPIFFSPPPARIMWQSYAIQRLPSKSADTFFSVFVCRVPHRCFNTETLAIFTRKLRRQRSHQQMYGTLLDLIENCMSVRRERSGFIVNSCFACTQKPLLLTKCATEETGWERGREKRNK